MQMIRPRLAPRRFLLIAGPSLILLGGLGLTDLLGTISAASFFHPPEWINWAHLIVGLMVLTAGLFATASTQAGIVMVPAIVGTAIGALGLILGPAAAVRWALPELADPSDHLAHLAVGLLAWWAWLNRHMRFDER
jgi:hypothetical protein